ncbi:hypothetical protein F0562_009129 [Nyssa sinensis]|uniref:DUF6857 domain-containing protein n=1 Tax=Nyssa sinensis TaxID=561372 RepID=A0A5J4ZXB1_9ASTE|nr:hypothetical protein F0562_009129 [Nyssa sinensis]
MNLYLLRRPFLPQLDPRENLQNYSIDSVLKLAHLAKACTQENPQPRPSMRSIVVALMTLASSTDDWDVGSFYKNQDLVNLMSGRDQSCSLPVYVGHLKLAIQIIEEAMGHRNVAFLAAVHAPEEASATEGVIRCMSMFAELCELSQKDSAGPLVEQFLNLHQSMQKAAAVIDALLSTRFPEVKSDTYSSSSVFVKCKHYAKQITIFMSQPSQSECSLFPHDHYVLQYLTFYFIMYLTLLCN